jgi:hypothetical protein
MGKLPTQTRTRDRLTGSLLVLGGIAFILFPVIRPFFDESALNAAAGFHSASWILAHACGMAGFILLGLGLPGVYLRLQPTGAERLGFAALLLYWAGAGLTLPFFGAESFGLQVIGKSALSQNSLEVLGLANQVRFGPGLGFIGAGLLLVAAAMILLSIAVWKGGLRPRWAGLPLAFGFLAYMPTLQGAPAFQIIRIVLALVITAGCLLVARGILVRGAAAAAK